MALENYILKNFFSTVTLNFKEFENEDEDYHWKRSKIDGETYTCIRFVNHVKIFRGTVHKEMFHRNEQLIEFDV